MHGGGGFNTHNNPMLQGSCNEMVTASSTNGSFGQGGGSGGDNH